MGSLLDITQIFIASLLTGPGYFAVSHTVRSIHRTERWTLTIVGRLYKVKLRPQNSPYGGDPLVLLLTTRRFVHSPRTTKTGSSP